MCEVGGDGGMDERKGEMGEMGGGGMGEMGGGGMGEMD